jgi:hypothetical protein
MPVTSSGMISINDIMTELGVSGETALNDEDIRGLISKSAGSEMAITEWYGASSGFAFTVNSDIQEASVSSLALAAGWNGTDPVEMTLASGKYLWSDNTATAGLTFDVANSTLINNGYIIGKGGRGGYYNNNTYSWDGNNYSGGDGGPALNITVGGTTVQNNSGAYIAGGGGGGRGGRIYGGGGAGGGQGHTAGAAIGQSSTASSPYGWIGTVGSLYKASWAHGSTGASGGGAGGAHWTKYWSNRYKHMGGGGGTGGGRVLPGVGGTGAWWDDPAVGTTLITYSQSASIQFWATASNRYAARNDGGSAGNAPPTPQDPTISGGSYNYSGIAGGGGWGANGGSFWRYDGTLIHAGDTGADSSGRGGAAITGTSRTVSNSGTIYGST